MKRYTSLMLTAMLAGPSAFASLNLDFRTDLRSQTYNTDAATDNTNYFNVKTGRLDYQGKMSEDMNFRVRAAFNKNATATNNENVQTAVEYAYVTNKMTDALALTVGRYNSDVGGFEGMTSGADLYMTSAGYLGLASSNLATVAYSSTTSATNIASSSKYLYITGARLAYKFMDTHEVALQIANPIVTSATTRLTTGLVVKGSCMDKSLNYVVNYLSAGAATAAPGKDENVNLIGAGVTYLFANNLIGTDMLMNQYKRNPTATTSATEKSTTNNVTYAYKGLETITPMLKYSQTVESPDSATSANKTTTTGMSAVAEYQPKKDQMVRYHVAYSQLSDKTDSVSATPSQTEILVGMRFNGDFLK